MNEEYTYTTSFFIVQLAKLHRQRISDEFAKLGIFVGQDMILKLLWEENGLTQTQIINKLKVEPPTITKMIHRMEKAGLLRRKRDSQDARVSRVYLTEQGYQLKEPIIQVWSRLDEALMEGITDQEQASLNKMLKRLLRNMS
ncbi:MarR family winged helix-turn-helix transcriptional regulator [Bacillus horti]|uniref:DNA-binding MarR family transcriptional regulator n=1 Tax=Caldalkalibacillus horti TaxID=77523 RepID=A0ABT9VWG5_9BACI|nr:MarR family transcriptional regulator [Bacillus horti]MDQ0165338.1 DNA-binding MarR family transcriptional regulator [Bacillus horti]